MNWSLLTASRGRHDWSGGEHADQSVAGRRPPLTTIGFAYLFDTVPGAVEVVGWADADGRRPVDVVCVDLAEATGDQSTHIDRLVSDPRARQVVGFAWSVRPERIDAGLARGLAGYLSKRARAGELVEALLRITGGECVVSPTLSGPPGTLGPSAPVYERLTPREASIVALIARGLSNQEIADEMHLSINSVKSCIRNAYRKMGITRRSQAVAWALEHGYGDPGRAQPAGAAG